MAWERLIASSCHDSVTGCGVDETAIQVAARIAEAEHLGQAVGDGVVTALARDVAADAALIINPSPVRRTGLVPLTFVVAEDVPTLVLELADGSLVVTQEIDQSSRLLLEAELPAEELREALIRRSFGQELFNRRIQAWTHDERTVTFYVGRVGDPTFDIDAAADEIDRLARASGGLWTLRILTEPLRTVLANVPTPALGWTTARVAGGDSAGAESASVAAVSVTESTLDNGLVSVSVRADGCLRVTAADGTVLNGVGRVVDGGDVGDTYNYGPPAQDLLIESPDEMRVCTAETGPLLGAFVVDRVFNWPAGLTSDRKARSPEVRPTTVTMRVELRTGEPFVRLSVDFVNQSTDHRARLHIALAAPAMSSYAEGQFAVTKRGLTNEGGWGEEPIPTYPASGFVEAGGAAVLLEHASEYELVDGGRELALTLLRAVGQLSRSIHPYREEPAGPEIPTPDAQCLGATTTRIAVMPRTGSWSVAGVLEAAERFRYEVHAVPGSAAPGLPLAEAEGLTVTGEGVVLSSLRRRDDWLELRVVAEHEASTVALLSGVRAARRTDLFGNPGADLPLNDDRLELSMRPWEIATIQLQLTGVS